MEKSIFWTILGTLFGGIALIQNHLSSRQKAKKAQNGRRFNAERIMLGFLSSVLKTLQWYVEIPASPGPKLERDSMNYAELTALTDVIRSFKAFKVEFEQNAIDLDDKDLLLCKSFCKQVGECKKFRRLAQVQRQDWFIAMEQIRRYTEPTLVPSQLTNLAN